jgi:uncharacterized iron-regulated membrane protein
MKQIILKAHMILGLVSGIILFIVAITGAMYSFKSEIESLTQGYRKVAIQSEEVIPPSTAIGIGKEANPDVEIHGIVYRNPDDALEIIYYQADPFFYGAAYLNPYTGEILKKKDFYKSFFGFALRGHISLWLPFEIGTPVVAVASIIFLIMFISGLILWWPRKSASTKSFAFSKGAKPSVNRLEWHKVIGFYVAWLGLIFVLTGMTWVFKGFDNFVYRTMGGEKETAFSIPSSDTTKAGINRFDDAPIDVLWNRIRKQYPDIPFLEIHAVHDSVSSYLVELNRHPSLYWKMDFLYFDQHTLEPVEPEHIYGSFDQAGVPEKVKRMYYDIHTGAIWGLPGKIIMFLASLFIASLPVTGFLIWWNRQKERRAFRRRMKL